MHVFAVNPYGGSPDVKSHLEGRMKNIQLVLHCVFHLFFSFVVSYSVSFDLGVVFDIIEAVGSNAEIFITI